MFVRNGSLWSLRLLQWKSDFKMENSCESPIKHPCSLYSVRPYIHMTLLPALSVLWRPLAAFDMVVLSFLDDENVKHVPQTRKMTYISLLLISWGWRGALEFHQQGWSWVEVKEEKTLRVSMSSLWFQLLGFQSLWKHGTPRASAAIGKEVPNLQDDLYLKAAWERVENEPWVMNGQASSCFPHWR